MISAAEQSRLEGHLNRLRVWQFFQRNPCHSRRECASELGLSDKTVTRHTQAIRDGWRPPKIYFQSRMDHFIDARPGVHVVVGRGPNRFLTGVMTHPDQNPEDNIQFVASVLAEIFLAFPEVAD